MKYFVNIDKLAEFIGKRPGLIKKILNPTEELLVKAISSSPDSKKFLSFIPMNLRTLAVVRGYINSRRYYGINMKSIPQNVINQFTQEDKNNILESRCGLIEEFQNPTKDDWLFALKKGYKNFEKVPKNIWNQDLVLEVLEDCKYNVVDFKFDIPGLWTEDFALKVLDISNVFLKLVPKSLITRPVLTSGLRERIDLEGIDIPDSSWTEELADQALECSSCNWRSLPIKYLTKERICKIAKEEGVWDELPIKDYDVFVAYISGCDKDNIPDIKIIDYSKKFNIKKFVTDVTKAGAHPGIFEALEIKLTKELWLDILTANPENIRYIDKIDQTETMVDVVLNNANIETLDSLDRFINMGKIKAHHAPLLLESKSPFFREIVRKHLQGIGSQSAGTVEIDLAPTDYAKFKHLLE